MVFNVYNTGHIPVTGKHISYIILMYWKLYDYYKINGMFITSNIDFILITNTY